MNTFRKLVTMLMVLQELLYICQSVSGTSALSPAFLRQADDIAACIINFGGDLGSSLTCLPRFSPGALSSKTVRATCTAADLAFSALVMQTNPCGSLSSHLSLYLRLISKLGLDLDIWKLHNLAFCTTELVRYKSTCLDLLLSPHQLDLCKLD